MATPNNAATNAAPTVDSANQIVQNNPKLVNNAPSETASIIASGASSDTAAGISSTAYHASVVKAVSDHQTNYNSQSWWQKAAGDVAKVVNAIPGASTLTQWANTGLQEVQSDYKFIHAVYTDHGIGAGILTTLGVVAGGTAGFLAGGPTGAVLGADLAASGERRLLGNLVPSFEQAYAKSQDPNYQVSIGRDIANGLSNIPGLHTLHDTQHGIGQFISGASDAAFDFGTDPLAKAGSIASSLKAGKYLKYAEVTDETGEVVRDALGNAKTLLDANGKPIIISTIPLARSSTAYKNFLTSVSGKALNSDMVMNAYKAGGVAGAFNNVFNPVTRAFDHIAELAKEPKTFPITLERSYPGTNFTPEMIDQLKKVKTGEDVAAVIGKSMYSGEISESVGNTMNNMAFVMPTRTLGRALTAGAVDRIVKKAGDTTIADERNLLLPKRLPVYDENGEQQFAKDAEGNQVPITKFGWGGLLTRSNDAATSEKVWNGWNAMANKVRTFTGYKSLVINKQLLEQSNKEFKFTDKGVGNALFNMFYYAMPRDVALEKAAEIIAEPNFMRQQELYGAGVKEVIKAAGLPEDYHMVRDTMSLAQRATTGGSRSDMISGYDHLGNAVGTVEIKASKHPNDELATPKDPQELALFGHQRGSNAFIDLKQLRTAMRQATIHGLMYSPKVDDWYTYYTDKIFAPMTLFTTGFGLRVASSEALHQVMRAGLKDYLTTKVAFNAAGYKYGKLTAEERSVRADMLKLSGPEQQMNLDRTVQGATEEDLKGLETDKPITSNEVTDLIQERAAVEKNLEDSIKDDPELTKIARAKGLILPHGALSAKIAPYVAKDKMRVLLNWHLKMGGLTVPAGVASDHMAHYAFNQAERASMMVEQYGHGATGDGDIMGLTGKDKNYHAYWAQNLSKMRNEVMAQNIAGDYLRIARIPGYKNLSADEIWNKVLALHTDRIKDPHFYKEYRDTLVGLRDGKPESFAEAQVKAIRGLVTGQDGTIHTNLLRNIAGAKRTYSTDLKAIPPISSPAKVLGREPRNVMDNPVERVLQLGYRKFINPVMDSVSREPIFAHYLYENYRNMKPLLDAGHVSEDEMLQIAGQKAVINMVPLIHNPMLKSQFGTMARNLLPFYFAQEQAFKRYSRLVYANPQALRDFQMINHGINNPGFVHTDSSGNKYMVYPLVGEFGNAILRGLNALHIDQTDGLPESVTGNTSSLLSVLPEMKMPGINPLASIPLNELANKFTWGNKLASFASGGYPDPTMLQTIFPNSAVRDVWDGLTMNDKETSVHNATLSAIAAAYYHGDLPDNYSSLPPARQQQIMDRINNNARSNLFLKGLFSFFLPLSPSVSNDYYDKNLQTLSSEYINLLSTVNPDTKKTYTLPEALSKFTSDHGSRAVSYTVSHTQTGENGADLPLADSTLAWLKNNNELLNNKDYQFGAAYLIPQTTAGKDALQVENELLAMQFRSRKTPQEFMDSLYVAKGWADVATDFNAYQADLKAARDSGNRNMVYQATQNWNTFAQQYGVSNPTWYADYTNPTRLASADNALSSLQKMNAKGLITGPQADGIKGLLSAYDQYHADLQASTITVAGTVKHTPMYSIAQNNWFNYLTALESDSATSNLTNVINGVFKRVK